MKNLVIFVLAMLIGTVAFSQKKAKNLEEWKAAAWEAKALTDAEKTAKPATYDLNVGKVEYNKACRVCHGETGLGDGSRARTLKTFSGDFSVAEFHKQKDEDIFWKTKYGGADMPKYAGKISDEKIWHMVGYMRAMKK